MARKTISVDFMKDMMNNILSLPGVDVDSKRTLCTVLESMLFETGNYRGFSYNSTYDPANWTKEDEYNRHYS